jgi:hypothetical protein
MHPRLNDNLPRTLPRPAPEREQPIQPLPTNSYQGSVNSSTLSAKDDKKKKDLFRFR